MVQKFKRNVTKFEPYKVLKLIAWGKLTCDQRVVLHRVGRVQGLQPARELGGVRNTIDAQGRTNNYFAEM